MAWVTDCTEGVVGIGFNRSVESDRERRISRIGMRTYVNLRNDTQHCEHAAASGGSESPH